MSKKLAIPAVDPMNNSIICSMRLVLAEEGLAAAESRQAEWEERYQAARMARGIPRDEFYQAVEHARGKRNGYASEAVNLRFQIEGHKPSRPVDLEKGIWETLHDAPLEGGLVQAGLAAVRYERSMDDRRSRKYWGTWAGKLAEQEGTARFGYGWLDPEPTYKDLGFYFGELWKRLQPLGERHIKVWQSIVDDEQGAPEREKLAGAFRKQQPRDIPAGQGLVRSSGKRKISRTEQVTEQGFCELIYYPADLRAKVLAELNEHELSRDWDERGGARGQQGYQWAMEKLIRGEEVFRHQFEDSLWACLSKISSNGAVLLAEDEHGCVHAFSDPDYVKRDDEDAPRWPNYPGCPDDVNPMAGRYLTRELGEKAIVRAWRARDGQRASDKVIARWVNEHREMLSLEGCRWMSADNAGRIKRDLVERGKLVQRYKEEQYRKMHQWRTLPAAYIVPEAGKDKAILTEEQLLDRTRETLRHLKTVLPPWRAHALVAFLLGPRGRNGHRVLDIPDREAA